MNILPPPRYTLVGAEQPLLEAFGTDALIAKAYKEGRRVFDLLYGKNVTYESDGRKFTAGRQVILPHTDAGTPAHVSLTVKPGSQVDDCWILGGNREPRTLTCGYTLAGEVVFCATAPEIGGMFVIAGRLPRSTHVVTGLVDPTTFEPAVSMQFQYPLGESVLDPTTNFKPLGL